MRTYLEDLANDPTVTVYDPMSGQFLKVGQSENENPDARTITLDTLNQVRTFVEIMSQRKKMDAVLSEV
jgi:hypothetical protein